MKTPEEMLEGILEKCAAKSKEMFEEDQCRAVVFPLRIAGKKGDSPLVSMLCDGRYLATLTKASSKAGLNISMLIVEVTEEPNRVIVVNVKVKVFRGTPSGGGSPIRLLEYQRNSHAPLKKAA